MNIENPDFSSEIAETQQESNISKSVVLIGVLVGLGMNWLTLYLNIVIGLLSVGISAFVVLLFTKILLREKATAQNLTLVSIAYGATSAAEASVGLLFIIWLYNNASSFGFENFEPPRWLLPSPSVLAERLVLTSEWILPLLVHYFLMLIPGITGLILGIYLAPKFINNEEEFPFPGVIQRVKTVEVLVTNQTSKISLFKRFCALGFIVALITLFYPVIDLSSVNSGFLLGIMLGTVGVTMFSVGFIINNPKISIPAGISSIVLYTFISPFLINISDFQDQVTQGMYSNDFFGLYSYLIQDRYLSFLIGFIVSVAIVSPIVFNRLKAIFNKIRKDNQTLELNDSSEELSSAETKNIVEYDLHAISKASLLSRLMNLIGKQELGIFSLYVLVLLVSTIFVVSLNVLPGTHVGIVFLLLIWIMFIGALVQGYITTSMIAKASAGSNIPFIFDNLPLFFIFYPL